MDWLVLQYGAEIAAGAQDPSTAVERAACFRERRRKFVRRPVTYVFGARSGRHRKENKDGSKAMPSAFIDYGAVAFFGALPSGMTIVAAAGDRLKP
jgi:hypothetical protein